MRLIFIIILNFVLIYQSNSQCGCSGAPIAGASPYGYTAIIGTQTSGSIFTSVYYRYSYGNQYYTGNKNVGKGYISWMRSHYVDLMASYGLSSDLSLLADVGYFIEKSQYFDMFEYSGSGLSNLSLSLKYHLYGHMGQKLNYYVGAGFRLPLNNFSEGTDNKLPQHIKSSTGAFGYFINSYLRKGFTGTDLNLFLINTLDFNGRNRLEYQYSPALYSSLILSKQITSGLTGILELRNELRTRDYSQNKRLDSTGSSVFSAAFEINYSLGKWNLSAMYDCPFYKLYNGSQLSTAYSASLNLSLKL